MGTKEAKSQMMLKKAKKCVKKGEKGLIEKDRETRIALAQKIDDEEAKKRAISMIEHDYEQNIRCFERAKKFLKIAEVKN
jgi:hypothetical protein